MNVIVEKLLINYKDEGKGKILLFLHGWSADQTAFDDLAKGLSSDFRVIRLDLPGFGQSQVPPESWRVQDYADLVVKFLQKIEVKDVYAGISHSFGGRVTIKLISQNLLQPSKVVFMGAAGIKPKTGARKLAFKSLAKAGRVATNLPVLKKLQPKLRRQLYAKAGADDYLHSGPMRQIFLHTINEDLTDEIGSITQPTLLIWGEDDDQTPVRDGYIFHEKLADSKLVIVPGAGHFVFVDDGAVVTRELRKFL